MSRVQFNGARRAQSGFTLVELMISLVLGLLVAGAAAGIFLSNQRTFRATDSLARIQENARVAFELMARDVREAAGNPCGKNLPMANVLNGASDGTGPWWMKWDQGLVGYDNGALAGSASGTDALEFLAAGNSTVTVTHHDQQAGNPGSPANFKVNTTTHGLRDNDIILVCDYTQASIVQLNKAADGNLTVEFNKGNATSPGNCTKGLGVPVICTANGSSKSYGPNSLVAKLYAVRWYVADNGRGGRSLFRLYMDKGAALPAEEVAEQVQDMQLSYLQAGGVGYVAAGAVTDWKSVVAVQISLSMQGTTNVGEGKTQLRRTLTHVVTLRNRTS